MANNKIIIGKGKENSPEKFEQTDKIINDKPVELPDDADLRYREEYLNDSIWGNDSILNTKLDEEVLAEKRMYVRVRYIQRIECSSIGKNIENEPVILEKPVFFTICDVSVGGLGILCDIPIPLRAVLYFSMTLDQISYDIKCEVVYCVQMEDKFRIGLKIVDKSSKFFRHLKILVARISLQSAYGNGSGQADQI